MSVGASQNRDVIGSALTPHSGISLVTVHAGGAAVI